MKVLAFLQNQWFRNPAKVKALYERRPELRNDLIARFLFMGCPTGKRLRRAFGSLCDDIIWEEASAEVGGHSASVFKADPEHVRRAVELHKPDVVLAFGKVAEGATRGLRVPVITGPHPAAHYADITDRLNRTADELRAFLRGESHEAIGSETTVRPLPRPAPLLELQGVES